MRKETRCRHIGYSFRLTARVLLYAPSHRQDNTYHGLCYTSRGALAGTRNSSMSPPHEGSIRRTIAPLINDFRYVWYIIKRSKIAILLYQYIVIGRFPQLKYKHTLTKYRLYTHSLVYRNWKISEYRHK